MGLFNFRWDGPEHFSDGTVSFSPKNFIPIALAWNRRKQHNIKLKTFRHQYYKFTFKTQKILQFLWLDKLTSLFKIANVIGIVIGHRRDKTIIHTAFGRAFEPNGPDILALGVWVLIWVKPVPDSENNMLFQFSTLKREKIGMVMGTRVVWFKSHEDVEPHQRIIVYYH